MSSPGVQGRSDGKTFTRPSRRALKNYAEASSDGSSDVEDEPMGVSFSPKVSHVAVTDEAPSTLVAKRSIEDYLESLSDATCDRLYGQPSSCLAVLRLLPQTAKVVVMRLLYLNTAVPVRLFYSWFNEPARKECTASLQKLCRLKVLKLTGDGLSLWLNKNYADSLHQALCGAGESTSIGVPVTDRRAAEVTPAKLSKYAAKQWEALLHYLAGSENTAAPDVTVQRILLAAGLVQKTPNGQGQTISNAGFQFLLFDTHVQVWRLLLQYLAMAESQALDSVAYLELYFTLGTLLCGQAYAIEPLSKLQRLILKDLQSLGLIYRDPNLPDCFFATNFAACLTSGISGLTFSSAFDAAPSTASREGPQPSVEEESNGFIILETNYRVYAYTSSELQISILGLFVEIRAKLCNIVVGMITRESIRRAVQRGISSNQIIRYLSKNAHPDMRRRSGLLPVTVMDQIRLWELERNRLEVEPGLLYFDFPTDALFLKFKEYAKSISVVIYAQDESRKIVCSTFAKEQLRQKLKLLRDEFSVE